VTAITRQPHRTRAIGSGGEAHASSKWARPYKSCYLSSNIIFLVNCIHLDCHSNIRGINRGTVFFRKRHCQQIRYRRVETRNRHENNRGSAHRVKTLRQSRILKLGARKLELRRTRKTERPRGYEGQKSFSDSKKDPERIKKKAKKENSARKSKARLLFDGGQNLT
jgi:hypothetical protein